MECAGHEFRQAEQPEHEGTDCIKKFWLKAFLIKSSNAEQNRNWRIWNSTARIWNSTWFFIETAKFPFRTVRLLSSKQ
jgi:hypothetical protein